MGSWVCTACGAAIVGDRRDVEALHWVTIDDAGPPPEVDGRAICPPCRANGHDGNGPGSKRPR